MHDTHTFIRYAHPASLILAATFSLIVAILASNLTAQYINNGTPVYGPSLVTRVHFMMFTGWWTLLTSVLFGAFFLTGMCGTLTSIAGPGHLAWLSITWIFWLAGSSAVSNALERSSCGESCYDMVHALEALDWVTWILFSSMIFFVALLAAGGVIARRKTVANSDRQFSP
ncbi:unnamed protein product [Sympodiomycopsis kandeliae]